MPYQLNEGSPLPVDITQSMTFDPVQSNQAIYVMNLVKQQENQAAFSVSTQSQKDAQTAERLKNNNIVVKRECLMQFVQNAENKLRCHSTQLKVEMFYAKNVLMQLNNKQFRITV